MTTEAEFLFDRNTCEDAIAAFVDSAKRSRSLEALVSLLPEQHPLYDGRGSNQTIRLRGYTLAAFEIAGLPDSALPFVLEELQNAMEAYLVAAAASALRGSETPSAAFVPYLLKAVANVKNCDDTVTFESYKPRWPLPKSTTALAEIFKTFEWLGGHAKDALPDLRVFLSGGERVFSARVRASLRKAIAAIERGTGAEDADCCSIPERLRIFPGAWRLPGQEPDNPDIEFEDHDGAPVTFNDFFTAKPSIVVFFYTRCDNPNKCSLTVTKLGWLQKSLAEQGLAGRIRTAAITYDPGFDLARRLKVYAEARGFLMDADNRVLRAPSGLKELRAYFRLGVNFINSIVNRHRIELFILDERGKVAFTFARLQWDIQEVIDHSRMVLEKSIDSPKTEARLSENPGPLRVAYDWVVSFLVPLAVVFFPKCPICWMAYLSLFGITGLQSIPYSPWLLPLFVILMLVNLLSVYRRGKHRNFFTPFYLSLLGVVLVLIPGMWLEIGLASYLGMAFLFSGSLISVLSYGKKGRFIDDLSLADR